MGVARSLPVSSTYLLASRRVIPAPTTVQRPSSYGSPQLAVRQLSTPSGRQVASLHVGGPSIRTAQIQTVPPIYNTTVRVRTEEQSTGMATSDGTAQIQTVRPIYKAEVRVRTEEQSTSMVTSDSKPCADEVDVTPDTVSLEEDARSDFQTVTPEERNPSAAEVGTESWPVIAAPIELQVAMPETQERQVSAADVVAESLPVIAAPVQLPLALPETRSSDDVTFKDSNISGVHQVAAVTSCFDCSRDGLQALVNKAFAKSRTSQ